METVDVLYVGRSSRSFSFETIILLIIIFADETAHYNMVSTLGVLYK